MKNQNYINSFFRKKNLISYLVLGGIVGVLMLKKMFSPTETDFLNQKQSFLNELNTVHVLNKNVFVSNLVNRECQQPKLVYSSKFASLGLSIYQNDSLKFSTLMQATLPPPVKHFLENTFFHIKMFPRRNILLNCVTGIYCIYTDNSILTALQCPLPHPSANLKSSDLNKIHKHIYENFISRYKVNNSTEAITLTFNQVTNNASFLYGEIQREEDIPLFQNHDFKQLYLQNSNSICNAFFSGLKNLSFLKQLDQQFLTLKNEPSMVNLQINNLGETTLNEMNQQNQQVQDPVGLLNFSVTNLLEGLPVSEGLQQNQISEGLQQNQNTAESSLNFSSDYPNVTIQTYNSYKQLSEIKKSKDFYDEMVRRTKPFIANHYIPLLNYTEPFFEPNDTLGLYPEFIDSDPFYLHPKNAKLFGKLTQSTKVACVRFNLSKCGFRSGTDETNKRAKLRVNINKVLRPLYTTPELNVITTTSTTIAERQQRFNKLVLLQDHFIPNHFVVIVNDLANCLLIMNAQTGMSNYIRLSDDAQIRQTQNIGLLVQDFIKQHLKTNLETTAYTVSTASTLNPLITTEFFGWENNLITENLKHDIIRLNMELLIESGVHLSRFVPNTFMQCRGCNFGDKHISLTNLQSIINDMAGYVWYRHTSTQEQQQPEALSPSFSLIYRQFHANTLEFSEFHEEQNKFLKSQKTYMSDVETLCTQQNKTYPDYLGRFHRPGEAINHVNGYLPSRMGPFKDLNGENIVLLSNADSQGMSKNSLPKSFSEISLWNPLLQTYSQPMISNSLIQNEEAGSSTAVRNQEIGTAFLGEREIQEIVNTVLNKLAGSAAGRAASIFMNDLNATELGSQGTTQLGVRGPADQFALSNTNPQVSLTQTSVALQTLLTEHQIGVSIQTQPNPVNTAVTCQAHQVLPQTIIPLAQTLQTTVPSVNLFQPGPSYFPSNLPVSRAGTLTSEDFKMLGENFDDNEDISMASSARVTNRTDLMNISARQTSRTDYLGEGNMALDNLNVSPIVPVPSNEIENFLQTASKEESWSLGSLVSLPNAEEIRSPQVPFVGSTAAQTNQLPSRVNMPRFPVSQALHTPAIQQTANTSGEENPLLPRSKSTSSNSSFPLLSFKQNNQKN